jgi:hypothetical protein
VDRPRFFITFSIIVFLLLGAGFVNAAAGDLGSWNTTSSMGVPRCRFEAVASNNQLYAIGGQPNTQYFQHTSVEQVNVNPDGSLGVWIQTTPLPSERTSMGAIATNDFVYVIGGWDEHSLNSVLRAPINFDGSLGDWQEIGPLAIPMTDLAVLEESGFIYAIAGTRIQRTQILPDGNLAPWVIEPNKLNENRGLAAAVAYGGHLYVLGGAGGNPFAARASVERASINPDGSLGAFELMAAMTLPRHDLAAVVSDGFIYAIGGYDLSSSAYDSIERAKIHTDGSLSSWSIVSNMQQSRRGLAVVLFTNNLYAIGGTSGTFSCLTSAEYSTLELSESYPLLEEFDSSVGFISTDPDVYIADGLVYWHVWRNGGQQYVYRDIPAFSGDVRVTVRGQVDGANNNCSVAAGIGDGIRIPGQPFNGVAVTYGYFGGGCPIRNYLINAWGVQLDHSHLCTSTTGTWLWVNRGVPYTAELLIQDGAATLSVPGVGSVSGTPTYSGEYNTLFVGLTGDGDWPQCWGTIDSIAVEQLSHSNVYDVELTSFTFEHQSQGIDYASDTTVISADVTNNSTESISGTVKLYVNGNYVGSGIFSPDGSPLPPSLSTVAEIIWHHDTDFGKIENAEIQLVAEIDGKVDQNPSDNQITDSISVYWSDWDMSEDAYSFSNMGYTKQMLFDDIKLLSPYLPSQLSYGRILGYILWSKIAESGHCFGMSSSSILYHSDPTIIPNGKDYTYLLDESEAYPMIRQLQRQQLFIRPLLRDILGPDPIDEFNLASQLISENSPVEVSLTDSSKDGRARHSVVAYKALVSSHGFELYFYDNNYYYTTKIGEITTVGNFKYLSDYDRFTVNNVFEFLSENEIALQLLKNYQEWILEGKFTSIHIGSPVYVIVVDSQGNRLGILDNQFYSEIPGGNYWEIGEEKFLVLPSDTTYSLILTGYENVPPNATMDISYSFPINWNGLLDVEFIEIPVLSGGTYTTEVGNDENGISPLQLPAGSYKQPDNVSISYVYDFPPVAEIGGPYESVEGGSVFLDATGSSDPDNAIVSYEWDLDNDGEYDDATGVTSEAVWWEDGLYSVGLKVTDEYGESDTDETTVVVSNLPPVVHNSLSNQIMQYSDYIFEVTITATDVLTDPMTPSESGIPDFLALSEQVCIENGNYLECTWTLTGEMGEMAGLKTINLAVTDDEGASSTTDFSIEVLTENASISFRDSNPVSVEVAEPGEDSLPFSLFVEVRETLPDMPENMGAPGDISLAEVSMTLSPVGPGAPVTGVCAPVGVENTGYDAVLTVQCDFSEVPVNTYTVQAFVIASYYAGYGEDVVTVYDPSLGFTTGGGWFYWPDSGEKTNFGFTMRYNKKGTRVQGNFLLIRHMPDGTIFRIKSNALFGLAIGENGDFGWATFSGKATYAEPGWPEPEGNYSFVVYVEDHGQSGDQIWIEIQDRTGEVVGVISFGGEASESLVPLEGGNLIVPH